MVRANHAGTNVRKRNRLRRKPAANGEPHKPIGRATLSCGFGTIACRSYTSVICSCDFYVVAQPLDEPARQSPHPLAPNYPIAIECTVIEITPDLRQYASVLRFVPVEDDTTR